jgi:hypothetical protein
VLFNSVDFLVFLVVVYGLYLALRHRWQNWMLLVGLAFPRHHRLHDGSRLPRQSEDRLEHH